MREIQYLKLDHIKNHKNSIKKLGHYHIKRLKTSQQLVNKIDK